MENNQPKARRSAQRGEGNLRLIIFLLLVAVLAYLGIQNIPTYFQMQSFKHDIAELARGAGASAVPVDKVRQRAREIALTYDVPVEDVTVTKDGIVLSIKVDTTRMLNFIVTDYEWNITQETRQAAY